MSRPRLIVVWDGISWPDLPDKSGFTPLACAVETFHPERALDWLAGGTVPPGVQLGTGRPVGEVRWWVGDVFAGPTAPAGDDWPVPLGATLPPDMAADLAGSRVKPEAMDAAWLSFFRPDWSEIDQDRDGSLILLALAWSEAMTLAAVVEKLAPDIAPDVPWLVRLRFPGRVPGGTRRVADFLGLVTARVAAAVGGEAAVVGLPPWPFRSLARSRGFTRGFTPAPATWSGPHGLAKGEGAHAPGATNGGGFAPTAVSLALEAGLHCLKSWQWDQAATHFSRARAVDPDDPFPLVGLTVCALRRRDWAAAEELSALALALDPTLTWASFYRGRVLLKLGRIAQARPHFLHACRNHPTIGPAAWWLAWIDRRGG